MATGNAQTLDVTHPRSRRRYR